MKLKNYIQATLSKHVDSYRGINVETDVSREWETIFEFYNTKIAPSLGYPGRIQSSDLDENIYAFRCDMYEIYGRRGSDMITECEKEDRCDINYCEGCDQYYYDAAFDCDADRCNGCAEEYEDTDDSDSYGVPGYQSDQSTRRSWKPDPKIPHYGVELETLVKETDNVSLVYNKIVDRGFLGERDGSLDSRRGIEIVGKPMTFEQNREEWLGLLESLRGKVIGWMAGTGYGMHVSVNRKNLSRLHQGKFLVFIHANKSLCEKIAGRKEVHWCSYHPGKKVTDAKRVYDDKYQAVSLRSEERMEVRIFRSTLSPEGFMRNLEFVAAAVDFTRTHGISQLRESVFREWLRTGGRRKQYPNLFATLNPKPKIVEQSPDILGDLKPVTE
jgi:hypothetical protein